MAAQPVGYECEFVEAVPEDYYCKKCKHVARDPQVASCCTESLCKACIDLVIQEKQPCPSCESKEIEIMGPHKKYQTKILALEVYCTLRGRGCEWSGQLGHLDNHLDLETGDCQHIGIAHKETCEIPGCGATFMREKIDEHMRENTQKHVSLLGATVLAQRQEIQQQKEEIQKQRKEIEQQKQAFEKEKQTEEQKLEAVRALEQSTERKLDALKQAFKQTLLESRQALEKSFEEQIKELKQFFEKQQHRIEQNLREQFRQELKKQKEEFEQTTIEQQEKTGEIEEDVNAIGRLIGIMPYIATFSGYQKAKEDVNKEIRYIDSPPIYTHPAGYKIELTIWPNGVNKGAGTHLTVEVYSLEGVSDHLLKFPVKIIFTLELVNQHSDQNHLVREIECEVAKQNVGCQKPIGSINNFIPLADLDWNADKETHYLKDDCLKIRVKDIEWFVYEK